MYTQEGTGRFLQFFRSFLLYFVCSQEIPENDFSQCLAVVVVLLQFFVLLASAIKRVPSSALL